MPTTDLLDRLRQECDLVLEAAVGAGWDAPIPGLTWDVRAMVLHLGAVHRWATDIVGQARPKPGGSSRNFASPDLTDVQIPTWFTEGSTALLEELDRAPTDLQCWTMLDDLTPREFWIRRQAHEAAIHRADVAAAAGSICTFDPDFAQSGLTELVGGFVREPAFAVDRSARLLLRATDGPAWRVTFGGAVNEVESAATPASWDEPDAAVTGTSSALYLWGWNRPTEVEVQGDVSVAELWHNVAI